MVRKKAMTPPQKRQQGSLIIRQSGVGLALIALALFTGLQLGGFGWRYRKWIWRFQGLAFGAVAGYVVGKLDQERPEKP